MKCIENYLTLHEKKMNIVWDCDSNNHSNTVEKVPASPIAGPPLFDI